MNKKRQPAWVPYRAPASLDGYAAPLAGSVSIFIRVDSSFRSSDPTTGSVHAKRNKSWSENCWLLATCGSDWKKMDYADVDEIIAGIDGTAQCWLGLTFWLELNFYPALDKGSVRILLHPKLCSPVWPQHRPHHYSVLMKMKSISLFRNGAKLIQITTSYHWSRSVSWLNLIVDHDY